MSWTDTQFRKFALELIFPDYSFPDYSSSVDCADWGNWLDMENFSLISRWKVFHLWQDQLVRGKFVVPVVKRMSRSKSVILKGLSGKKLLFQFFYWNSRFALRKIFFCSSLQMKTNMYFISSCCLRQVWIQTNCVERFTYVYTLSQQQALYGYGYTFG